MSQLPTVMTSNLSNSARQRFYSRQAGLTAPIYGILAWWQVTFDIETPIRAMPLTFTSLHSCGSFCRTFHSLMGSGRKGIDTLAKPISLRWLAYLAHPHKNCWIGQTVQRSLVYTLRRVCTILQADDAHEPLVIFADYKSSSQVNSNIHNSFPQRLLPFRTWHRFFKGRISGCSSSLHLRCLSGYQRSDRVQKTCTMILGSASGLR